MKAAEYFDKYQGRIFPMIEGELTEEQTDIILDLFREFAEEVVTLCESRLVKTNESIVSVLKEQNQKWNALCRIFVKQCGISPIKEDGLIVFYRLQIPEYAHLM